MIDHLSIGLTHLLMALALWRLLGRDDLDHDPDTPVNATDPQEFTERRMRPRRSKVKSQPDA